MENNRTMNKATRYLVNYCTCAKS